MKRIMILVAAISVLVGWIAGGSRQTVQAREASGGQMAGEWRMHSDPTPRRTWLYNVKTGKVYRVLGECAPREKLGAEGCLSPLPVLSNTEAALRDSGLGLLPKSR